MTYSVVIGAGFGDEGKGRVVHWLCRQKQEPMVVRFCGGQQAGHTVVSGGLRHVFSNFGAGALAGAPTYWSKHCTFHPTGVLNELAVLHKKGIEPKLYVHADCPITTPYEIVYQRRDELNVEHGTCGVGVGSTWERESMGHHITFKDLFYDSVLRVKLELLRDKYYYSKEDVEPFIMDCRNVREAAQVDIIDEAPVGQLVFEGAQGLLLDRENGFFPHVTRGHTGMTNVLKIGKDRVYNVYLVTRAYQTRHGVGPMTNQATPFFIEKDPDEANVDGGFQGEFRRSMLDVDLLRYAVMSDSYLHANRQLITLVVTCVDHLEEFSFSQGGRRITYPDAKSFCRALKAILSVRAALMSQGAEGELVKL